MLDLAASMLMAGMPLTAEVRDDLIITHYPQAQKIGKNFAYRRGLDIDEYISVASYSLVMVVHKITPATVPNPSSDGISKVISKGVKNRCYNFLRDGQINQVQTEPLDEDICAVVTDVHNFFDDLIITLSGEHCLTDNEKQALYDIGQGFTVRSAARKGDIHHQKLARLLNKIRQGATKYVL